MPARTRLTAKLLAALKPGDLVRDETVRGLFAVAGANGAVSLKLQVDLPGEGGRRTRRTLRKTLGRYPTLSLDAARAEAMRLLAEVREGRDPRGAPPGGAWTVGYAFGKYLENLSKRAGSELTQRDMRGRLERYLAELAAVPLASLTRDMCEALHKRTAEAIRARARQGNATGARTANAVIVDIASVWEFARDFTPLPALSPVRRIAMFSEAKAHHEVPVAALAEWWGAIGELRNPSRRAMHRLGLLSGLRPGNLRAIEISWIDLEAKRIAFPAAAMKGRRPFVLPLSAAMAEQVHLALRAGEYLRGGTRWLFPSVDRDGKASATRTIKEKCAALRGRTGHALRHTYKTCARLARIPESTIAMLMAHRLGGMADVYGSLADQFEMLLEAQETVSAWILGRVTAPGACGSLAPGGNAPTPLGV